ncbi:sulfate/molybdate ABC transporter ATP-binding protein [Agromyces italicus]|uniref:sulfate/molybdate ABC transporter ATP-binding protein n=1 Tax=Agromyces italicus TaxID=279572 RepID=UPI000422A9D4|nr:ABC transporter ATP-binding protein [Agromyces italicus]
MSADPESGALVAELTTARGTFHLSASLRVDRGELLAVLGPNGSGKSTLLAVLAGHVAPDEGIVRLGERELARRIAGERASIDVPIEQRRIGLLGQEPLLFRHLSALENVAFGPRALGRRAAAARADAARWLDRVGAGEFAARKPAQLSGGQQQRVAIARTLAAGPELLLLDEPFAALDVPTAAAMRRLIGELCAETATPTVLVTHDPLDAIVLARRAAILHEGRIVQLGPVGEVLGHPATSFVAALAGVNLAVGTATTTGGVAVSGADGSPLVLAPAGLVEGRRATAGRAAPGSPVSAVFSPAAVHVAPFAGDGHEASDEAVPNRWIGTVSLLQPAPGGVRLTTLEHPELAVDLPGAAAVALDLRPGSRFAFTVSASEISVREHG